MLELFASQQSDRLWRIDPQRLLNYLRRADCWRTCCGSVEEHAAEGIPETVGASSTSSRRSRGHSGHEDGSLIEFSPIPAVAAIWALTDAGGRVCLPAGPRHVAVSKKMSRRFVRR